MATKPKSDPAPNPADTVPSLRVTSKRDGFRRAGRAWRGTEVVPISDFTDEQIVQLENDPMLVVDRVGAVLEDAG